MPRKKRQKIKIDDSEALEGLLQEAYNDACSNIISAQNNINEMSNAAEPQDVDDLTKIAKEKTSALKVKDSAIRLKLEIAKTVADIIKNKGNVEEAISERSGGKVSLSDFKAIRKMMEDNANSNNDDENED